jgi:predicted enzyme related to lactoylglutathione lyase
MLAKVVLAGGQVLYPKTSIGELGCVAKFEDSEGTCIALSED